VFRGVALKSRTTLVLRRREYIHLTVTIVWCSEHEIKCTQTRLHWSQRRKQTMVKFLKKDIA